MRNELKGFFYSCRKYCLIILLVVACVILCHYFCPRNVDSLIFRNREDCTFTLWDHDEGKEIILTVDQQADLRELFSNQYAYRKVIENDYVNDVSMNYLLFISGSNDTIHLWTPDIISVNGIQYKLFRKIDVDSFISIVESEGK